MEKEEQKLETASEKNVAELTQEANPHIQHARTIQTGIWARNYVHSLIFDDIKKHLSELKKNCDECKQTFKEIFESSSDDNKVQTEDKDKEPKG